MRNEAPIQGAARGMSESFGGTTSLRIDRMSGGTVGGTPRRERRRAPNDRKCERGKTVNER